MAPLTQRSAQTMDPHSHITSKLELKYTRSTHEVELIAKDEAIRKLRVENHVLDDDAIEARDLWAQEQERADLFEQSVNRSLERAEEAENALLELEKAITLRDSELSTLRAESLALKSATTNASKLMTEKLELTRELSTLKPEVEHLRIQLTTSQNVLAEKLALQRQLADMESELSHSKREAQRALAKRRNTMHDMAQADELETLQKSLTREKRLREKAEESVEQLQRQVDGQANAVQQKTANETAKVENNAELETRCEQLKTELAKEKKAKAKLQKDHDASEAEWQSRMESWRDKISSQQRQVRNKTEAIKDLEARLEEAEDKARQAVAKQVKEKSGKSVGRAETKKRGATDLDSEETTSVAGRKKPKVAAAEMSTFSTTPFLNKTMSMIIEDGSDDGSPTGIRKEPLRQVSDSDKNVQKNGRSIKSALKPIEEDESGTTAVRKATGTTKLKPRKSVVSFAMFTNEPEVEKKKKRKLPALGSSLFDDNDDFAPRDLSAVRFGGRIMGGSNKGGSLLGGKRKGLLSTDDGFQFSPLKRR